MKKLKKFSPLWWLALIGAVISTIISFCSCTAGITIGKSNRIEQTVTNLLDSTITTFSLTPLK